MAQSQAQQKQQNQKKQQSPFAKQIQKQDQGMKFDASKELKDVMRRLRLLEERYESLRKKTEIIEDNMLKSTRDVNKEISLIKDEIISVKRDIRDIKDQITLIINELKLAPKKEDVDSLKKYIELWQPIEFVTEKDVERLVEWKLESFQEKIFKRLMKMINSNHFSKR